MDASHSHEQAGHLPWAVLGGVAWLAVATVILRRLPNYFFQDALLIGVPGIAALITARSPRSRFKVELAWFTTSWLLCVVVYSLAVVVTVVILLVGSSALGYLPYSDRPGPGWGNIPVHFPEVQEVGYFAGWAAGLLLPACAWWGGVIFMFAAWSSWFWTTKWLIRVLSALLSGISALLATAAAGWYIAIAPFPVYGAGFAGLLLGALIVPRFCGEAGSTIAPWKRTMLVSCATLLVAGLITYPFWRQRF